GLLDRLLAPRRARRLLEESRGRSRGREGRRDPPLGHRRGQRAGAITTDGRRGQRPTNRWRQGGANPQRRPRAAASSAESLTVAFGTRRALWRRRGGSNDAQA